ncbi:glycoside hydrolase [Daedaleopsis nitida]|nr:glycoside hydrolase [Daedaleopsis nitida]
MSSNPFEPIRGSIVDSSAAPTPRGSEYLAPPTGPQPDRSLTSTPADDSPFLPENNNKENNGDESRDVPARPVYKRPLFWLLTAGGIAIVVLAVVLPVYFVVIKPNQHNATSGNAASGSSGSSGSNNSGSGNSGSNESGTKNVFATGGDGSTVTKEDGSTFTYKNSFGGYWVSDPANPFDNSAKVNSWTPALNETWDWSKDRIWGVNLGGLFVLEPFIVPNLYQENPGAVDEWTLSQILAAKGPDVLQKTLEDHYNTFITEEDIAQIAGAGLNWVRLPIPFWAINKWDDVGVDGTGAHQAEPFLERTCWKYILRVLGWARKYGLRVNLDLHTMPGSQNGYNHSGKLGTINWMKSVMGLANAERSLDYIRIITEFISQPEWRDVVPMFGIVNEPYLHQIGEDQVKSFYLHAYEMVREITGTGAGNGPMISMHDGFTGPANWAGFLTGADRVALDTHPYFAFNGNANREPLNVTADGGDGTTLGGKWPKQACQSWADDMNTSRSTFGVTIAGEFSNAMNDCGLFVDGISPTGQPGGARYGPDCDYWEDAAGWSDATKQGLLQFALASMDALGDFFFWTWKIGNSTAGSAVGKCASFGVAAKAFSGQYAAAATGGAGAGNIAPAATAGLEWPPAAFTDQANVAALPQYTATGTVSTLPPPTFSPTPTVSVGNGWFDDKDSAPAVTPISGCAYPFAWDAGDAQVPASGCLPAQ